jgi:hypothetical protein
MTKNHENFMTGIDATDRHLTGGSSSAGNFSTLDLGIRRGQRDLKRRRHSVRKPVGVVRPGCVGATVRGANLGSGSNRRTKLAVAGETRFQFP